MTSLQSSCIKSDLLTEKVHVCFGFSVSVLLPHLSCIFPEHRASSSYPPPTHHHHHHHSPAPSFFLFTVQPTNFQHVQICCLCNHADDLATSAYINASLLNGAELLLISSSLSMYFIPFIYFNIDFFNLVNGCQV